MVTERNPVYVAFDTSSNPSSINIYDASDVVAESNGGTGVSSLSEVSSVLGASSLYVSGIVSSVSGYFGSGLNGMPYPPPFCYVEMDEAGTNSTDEQYFAMGADTTVITSDSNHITWNDTQKYFNVSAAGTYELHANLIIDGGAQNDQVRITSKKNGGDVMEQAPNLYGAVGPLERTFYNVLTAVATDYISVTIHMDSTKTCHLEAGSTLTIKRIK